MFLPAVEELVHYDKKSGKANLKATFYKPEGRQFNTCSYVYGLINVPAHLS